MAWFTDDHFKSEFPPGHFGTRIDLELFRHGPVTKFYRLLLLDQRSQQLQDLGYQVHCIDCSLCATEPALLTAIARALRFEQTEYDGVYYDSFEDWLWSIEVPMQGGTVLSLVRFDLIAHQFPEFAYMLLNILARSSHSKLVFGKVFMVLIQSNDPMLDFEPLGALRPLWNSSERMKASREL